MGSWAPFSTRCTREQAFAALWALLQTAPVPANAGGAWNLKSRRLVAWEDLTNADQPALFLHQLPQRASQPNLGLAEWRWNSACWIYYKVDNINSPNSGILPDTLVNEFVDSIEQTLLPVLPEERQTLGGLVVHCWIDGDVTFDAGLTDNQAVLLIPITIMVGC